MDNFDTSFTKIRQARCIAEFIDLNITNGTETETPELIDLIIDLLRDAENFLVDVIDVKMAGAKNDL